MKQNKNNKTVKLLQAEFYYTVKTKDPDQCSICYVTYSRDDKSRFSWDVEVRKVTSLSSDDNNNLTAKYEILLTTTTVFPPTATDARTYINDMAKMGVL